MKESPNKREGAPSFVLSNMLRETRLKKNITLETAEHDTKIRAHYLVAMEEGNIDLLPPSHSKGFFRKYGAYLGIDATIINQGLSEITPTRPKKQPFSPRALTRQTHVLITPKVVATVSSVIVLIAFIGYITYQVKQFAAPPYLEVTKPVGESVIVTDTVNIEGKTDPGATIYVDNSASATGANGTFSYVLTLRPGLNQITIRAENRIKKSTSKVISVLYQAPSAPSSTLSPSPSPSPEPSPSPTSSPSPTPRTSASKKPI